MFCKYKNIFGEPGKGVHSIRILNIAIVDVILTILLALVLKYFFKKYNFYLILSSLFILAIIAHRLFCVRTTIDKLLFN